MFNRLLHHLLLTPRQQWRQFLCHTEEAGEAKQPCPGQGQMAAPSIRVWGSRATLLRLQALERGADFQQECFQSHLQPSPGLPMFPPATPPKGFCRGVPTVLTPFLHGSYICNSSFSLSHLSCSPGRSPQIVIRC